MGNINVSGHMYKKSVVKDLNGNIITLMDEANGGYIIRNRQIVNPEKWAELVKKEKDKQESSKAQTMERRDSVSPDRTVFPSKVDVLEKKVEGMESKLDAILKALNEKKS